MSSISKSFEKNHSYKELNVLKSADLKKYKNIVLLVIDGLGYNYLIKHKNSFLYKSLKSKLTSTFLSTTTCANTSFLLGYPPQQHVLTRWDINLKEAGGGIVSFLPFRYSLGKENLSNLGFKINKILNINQLHKGFKADCYYLINKKISNSEFSKYVGKYTKIITFSSYKSLFMKLKKILNDNSKNKSYYNKRKFINLYLSEYDSLAHIEGLKSSNLKKFFMK